MTSSIAWMDTSADEQRQMREIIALFAQEGAVDELGIGQVRDQLSNLLFPGTTVLQTRARYFVLVPWGYQYVTRRGRSSDVDAQARKVERDLIGLLIMGPDDGVIGRVAGPAVKLLPSVIYWSGLITYGILTRDVSPSQLTGTPPATEGVDELVERRFGDWHPTLPPIPNGFPSTLDDGTGLKSLDLRAEEATWLRERMVQASRGTLLEHLLLADSAPAPATTAPWEDRLCWTAPNGPRQVMAHAQRFAMLVQGGLTLYNLLVAAAYEKDGFDRIEGPVNRYREEYGRWLKRAAEMNHLRDWDLPEFWRLIDSRPNRISWRTRAFIGEAVEMLRTGIADEALDEPTNEMRTLVSRREKSVKGPKSRLGGNSRMLGSWGGGSAAELTFRWTQVQRIVTDVHEGVARA